MNALRNLIAAIIGIATIAIVISLLLDLNKYNWKEGLLVIGVVWVVGSLLGYIFYVEEKPSREVAESASNSYSGFPSRETIEEAKAVMRNRIPMEQYTSDREWCFQKDRRISARAVLNKAGEKEFLYQCDEEYRRRYG